MGAAPEVGTAHGLYIVVVPDDGHTAFVGGYLQAVRERDDRVHGLRLWLPRLLR